MIELIMSFCLDSGQDQPDVSIISDAEQFIIFVNTSKYNFSITVIKNLIISYISTANLHLYKFITTKNI